MEDENMNNQELTADEKASLSACSGEGCAPRTTTVDATPVGEPVVKDALHIGIDVGSTTVKLAILDENNQVKYSVYRRHHADVRATIVEVLSEAAEGFGDERMTIAITGSGGLLLAQWLGIEFVQEVIASKTAVETFIPKTDVAIELGGEDAKIIYFENGIEQRMNGTCAGGTGAFIDQMAALLNTDAGGLNELAQNATTIYPIASRCGVFAKTDVQPLLNEGARKEDIAASIFQSVVTQTISGLACGRPIRGYVAFLGGPLQYLPELRKRFYETLELDEEHRIVPDNAHLFVASGCAIAGAASGTVRAEKLSDVLDRLKNLGDIQGSEVVRLDPLFATAEDYQEFKARHDQQHCAACPRLRHDTAAQDDGQHQREHGQQDKRQARQDDLQNGGGEVAHHMAGHGDHKGQGKIGLEVAFAAVLHADEYRPQERQAQADPADGLAPRQQAAQQAQQQTTPDRCQRDGQQRPIEKHGGGIKGAEQQLMV